MDLKKFFCFVSRFFFTRYFFRIPLELCTYTFYAHSSYLVMVFSDECVSNIQTTNRFGLSSVVLLVMVRWLVHSFDSIGKPSMGEMKFRLNDFV